MTRIELLRHLTVTLAGGTVGTTTAAGTAATLVDTALARYPNDHFIGWDVHFEGGTLAGVTTGATDFAGSTGTVTFPTQSAGAPGSGVRYILAKAGIIELLRQVIMDATSSLRELLPVPYVNQEITLDDTIFDYDVPFAHELDGTADSGNAAGTTLVDTALTQANDYWLGAMLTLTSGTQAGELRTVTDFTATDDTLTVEVPFSAQITTNTFTLYKFRPVTICHLQYQNSDGEWQEIPDAGWEITRNSGVPQLHFYDAQLPTRTRGRVWAIVDGRPLRIIGSRYVIEPNSDSDPVELPQGVMTAWCRYLYYFNQSVSAAIDPAGNIQKVQMAYQLAREEADNIRRSWPPNSRQV